MKLISLAALAVIWPVAVYAAEPLNFKGLQIGQPSSPTAVMAATGIKCGQGAAQMLVCNGYTSIGGSGGSANIVIDAGTLARVSIGFKPHAFDTIAAGLQEKFGKPLSDVASPVQSGAGARLENRVMTWRDATGNVLRVSRYAGRIDESSYMLITRQNLDKLEDLARRGRKDL